MLSDLIDHVPQLLEYLSSDSLAPILGTSSALRHIVHNHATKIIGHISDQDIAVLVKGPWPQVTHLSLKRAVNPKRSDSRRDRHLNNAPAVTSMSLL